MYRRTRIAIALALLGTSLAGCARSDRQQQPSEPAQPAPVPSNVPVTPVIPTTSVLPSPQSDLALYGAPLIFSPTFDGFGINAVVAVGDAMRLRAAVTETGNDDFSVLDPPTHPATNIAEWRATGLSPGTHYQYRIVAAADAADEEVVLFEGDVVTQRPPGQEFSFTVITDSHVPQPVPTAQQRDEIETVYKAVMSEVHQNEDPDFIVNLGDMLDFHLYGFNAPPLQPAGSRDAYMNYRALMGPVLGNAAHFPVIGNWEGENGCFSPEVIDRSLSQRLLYAPAPGAATYPQGGSPNEDYYAFEWGDALFVVLNVMTYTETCHDLSGVAGTPQDWTLGEDQFVWFEETLSQATAKWRFVLIHHVVGGAAGDVANSNYGRGGGQSAYIGEQALVHDLMLQAGVQVFFYGHDHVFTDMVVDGIHYTLPGSAGAPWKFDTADTGYVNYWPDSGYGRVRVSPTEVQVDFVALGGENLYSYVLPEDESQSLNTPPMRPDAGVGVPSVDAGPDDGGLNEGGFTETPQTDAGGQADASSQ